MVHNTGETIHAAMVVVPAPAAVIPVMVSVAARRMVWAVWRVGQRSEIVIKGVVLLHHDDDVLDFVRVPFTKGQPRAEQRDSGQRHQGQPAQRKEWHRYSPFSVGIIVRRVAKAV